MKTQKRVGKVKKAAAAPPSSQTPKTEPSAVPVTVLEYPPPEFLLREAEAEPDRRLVEDYAETIRTLRDGKRFTFREIAVWLSGRGIECDHNSVYRAYTKGLSVEEEQIEAQRSAEEDNEPA
jgi:hypothetical protein